jgi:phenylpropionate dioxygenase-like ring-hydroxylating dioxygenase large terminal subunit
VPKTSAEAQPRQDFNQVLKDYWHPVAFSSDVSDKPVGVQLLESGVVLFRSGGRVAAFPDLCIHRGTPLSLGFLDEGNLVCAYHGWTYNIDGKCVRIPALSADRSVPPKAHLAPYLVEERYGLVWVCMGKPRLPIARFPELSDPSFKMYMHGQEDWDSGAGRYMENFIDVTHFAWVHPGLLGDREHPECPPLTLRESKTGFQVEMDMDVPETARTKKGKEHILYDITLPFTVRQVRTNSEGDIIVFVAVSPLSPKRLRRFYFKTRNYRLDKDAELKGFSDIVAQQDRAIVETQRPEELPLDLREEMHTKGPDDPAITYRRLLSKLGVEPNVFLNP